MKKLLAIAVAASAHVFAQEASGDGAAHDEEEYISIVTGKPVPKDGKYTVQQYRERDERVMRKTGGFIHMDAEGPKALIADARARATLTADEVARVYALACHLEADIEKTPRGEAAPLEFAKRLMEAKKPLMAIVVVDGCGELPALSVFPEERIGIVNADRLRGGDDPSAPEVRVGKEMWRAIGFVGGLGFSMADNDVMQPYYTVAELDACRYPFIQPMNMARMQPMWKRFGVKKERRIPYRVAVTEGWAAAPTNSYQRAVWDEVHKIPEKPVTIEYDPAKGR